MKTQHLSRAFLTLAAFALATGTTLAGEISKAANTTALNQGGSWTGGTAPGETDVAVWNNTVSGAQSVAMGGDLTWAGIKVVNPGGAITVTGSNKLTLGAGGVDMSAATQNLTFGNGTFSLFLSDDQNWTVASGRTLSFSSTVGAGNVNLNGKTVTVNGAGTVMISGPNISNGTFNVTNGTLNFASGSGGNSRVENTVTVNVESGATFAIQPNMAAEKAVFAQTVNLKTDSTFKNVSGSAMVSGQINVLGNSTINTGTTTLTLQNIAGNGDLTISGGTNGKVILLGDAHTYNGNWTLTNTSTLLVEKDGATGTGTITLNRGTTQKIASSGTQDVVINNSLSASSGGASTWILGDATNTGKLTITGGVDVGGYARTLQVDSDVVISGVLSNNGAITKTGTGTLTLSGTEANTHGGAFTVSAGTLQIGKDNALGAGALTLNAGTTLSSDSTTAHTISNALTVSGDTTLGNVTNNGKLTFTNATGLNITGARTLTVNSDIEFTGASAIGTGNNAVTGPGALTLNGGGSTGTGMLRVRAGTLNLGGTWDSFVTFIDGIGGATTGSEGKTGTLNILAGANVTQSAGGFVGQNSAGYTGVMNVAGTYTVAAGRLAFANGSSAKGVLNINDGGKFIITGGTVDLAIATTNTAELHLNSGGTLETNKALGAESDKGTVGIYLNGGEVKTTADITGDAGIFNAGASGNNYNVYVQNGGAVFNTGDHDVTVANALKEDATSTGGGLTKKGDGTLKLTGDNNTYTGATLVNAGTLELAGAAIAGSDVTVNGGATLKITGSYGSSAKSVSSAGTVLLDGEFVTSALALTTGGKLSGTGVITGNVFAGSGTTVATVTAGNLEISGAADFAGATLELKITDDSTFGCIIADSIDLTGATLKIVLENVTSDLNGTEYQLFDSLSGSIAGWDSLAGSVATLFGTGSDLYEARWSNTVGYLDIYAIPEPSTYALFVGLAAVGVALVARRRKNTDRPSKTSGVTH